MLASMRSVFWRLIQTFRGRRTDDLSGDLEFHIQMETTENIRRGMSPTEARRRALVALGGVENTMQEYRDVHTFRWVEEFRRDLNYAWRMMRKTPLFTSIAVLILALGIGANMMIFTMVYNIVLRPVRYRDVGRLMDINLIMTEKRRGTVPMSWSYPKFEELRRWNQSFESIAAHQTLSFTLGGIDRPELLTGTIVSACYFHTIGIDAALGRVFSNNEDTPSWPHPVMLISDGLWRRDFGADPGAVGRTVSLGESPYTIVGVMQPGFRGESGQTDVWVPMAAYLTLNPQVATSREAHSLKVLGRLKVGFSPRQANEEMRLVVARMESEHPTTFLQAKWSGGVRPLINSLIDPLVSNALWILQAATAALLLIACLNLSGLLLGRTVARRREIAIRLALGVSRCGLIRQLLIEPVLLALLGGTAGLLLAHWGMEWIGRILPRDDTSTWFASLRAIRPETLGFELPLIALFSFVSVVVGLLFGFLPAWRAVRWDVNHVLKCGGAISGNPLHLRTRKALVVTQTAITLILLAGAGLMTRSFAARVATKVGAETRNIVTLRVATPRSRYRRAESRAFYEELKRLITGSTGIESVSLSDTIPLKHSTVMTGLSIQGNQQQFDAGIIAASPEYFALFRIPLLKGRLFEERDRAGGPLVVVINETAARQFFPGENPVGQHMVYPQMIQRQAEIVGVVGDVMYDSPGNPVMPDVYVSTLQSPGGGGILAVRTAGDPLAVVPLLREQIRSLDPQLPIYDMMTMDQRAAFTSWRARLSTALMTAMSLLALLLAALGIYGVFSYHVAARTRDIGLRMALGADRRDILHMIMREGLLLCAVSLALGLPAALGLSRLLTSQLYGITPYDASTFFFAVSLLAAIALTAIYVPARRASRINPMEILRLD